MHFLNYFETLKITHLPAIKKIVENAQWLKFLTCNLWSLLTFTEYSTSNWCKSRRVIESEEIFYSNTIPGQCYLVHIICNICKSGTKWSEFKVTLNKILLWVDFRKGSDFSFSVKVWDIHFRNSRWPVAALFVSFGCSLPYEALYW